MSSSLERWNAADESSALDAMMACCGARRWATAMVKRRPILDATELRAAADQIWDAMQEPDWLEAFACHPRIGEREASPLSSQSSTWSKQEQSSVTAANETMLAQLAEGNTRYEDKFGFTYIVCATGKSTEEMLSILKRRLAGDRTLELREAAEQQRQIMQIRLRKWLEQ